MHETRRVPRFFVLWSALVWGVPWLAVVMSMWWVQVSPASSTDQFGQIADGVIRNLVPIVVPPVLGATGQRWLLESVQIEPHPRLWQTWTAIGWIVGLVIAAIVGSGLSNSTSEFSVAPLIKILIAGIALGISIAFAQSRQLRRDGFGLLARHWRQATMLGWFAAAVVNVMGAVVVNVSVRPTSGSTESAIATFVCEIISVAIPGLFVGLAVRRYVEDGILEAPRDLDVAPAASRVEG